MKSKLQSIYLTREQYIDFRIEIAKQSDKEPKQSFIDSINKTFSQENWERHLHYYNHDEYLKYHLTGLIAINKISWRTTDCELAKNMFPSAPIEEYEYEYTNV